MGAGSLLLAGSVLVSPASAATSPTCGGTVAGSATLTSNLSCSGPNSGITLGSGSTLDCKGFAILADPAVAGEGPGIRVTSNSSVVNCTVKYFDAGIFLQPGGGNVISNNLVQDNITSGNAINFGDGILADGSVNNKIDHNAVVHNGPFDGIGLINKSTGNVIQANTVTNNNVPTLNAGGTPILNQDDGIRIEGPGAVNNQVSGNTVSGSGLEGIAVFGDQGTGNRNTGTSIIGNTVTGNGFNTLNRQGSGIRLFLKADSSYVANNILRGNAASGVHVDSTSNTITGNSATGNNAAGGASFDLLDTNANCDANYWKANAYGTAQPPCAARR
jgi:parallel beta-helix repeat protein